MSTQLDIVNATYAANLASAIGKRVQLSDGTPRPPERFNKKLQAWKNTNYEGTLEKLELATGMRAGKEIAGHYEKGGFIEGSGMLEYSILEYATGLIRMHRSGYMLPDLSKTHGGLTLIFLD